MADQITVAELDQYFTDSRAVRREFEPQWFLNLAMHDGKQWIAFDGRQLFEPELEPWRAKLVDNRIRGLIRKEVAKMTKQRPVWVGVPANSEDDEIDAARFRERLFEHDWTYLDMVRKKRAALKWSRICGAGFLKITWDSATGPGQVVYVGPDRKAVKDANGRPLTPDRVRGYEHMVTGLEPRPVLMGDPRIDVRTPFECYPDPLATEDGLESCRRFGEEAVYDPEYVYERFGEVLEPDAAATAGVVEARLAGRSAAADKRGVRVREWWCLPCSTYPQGCHVVYAQEQILLHEAMPYPWLPYGMYRGEPRPGSFWPTGCDDYISPQTELNKSLSQIAENADRIGNPPLLKPSSADFSWQGLPGEELEYQDTGSPVARPTFLDVPELPAHVVSRPDRAENSLREISHQHEVTSGSVPAGVTAASAINLLQEADDTVLGPAIEDMEATDRDIGRRVLWLRWRFCTDERMLRIAGEDGAWDLQAFRGQMLRNGGELDQVQAGSGLPRSKAAKQAAIAQVLTLFVQNGVPVNERQVRRALRDMEVGGLENLLADIQRDERQVNEENRRLFAGEQLELNAFDNDVIHIAGHEEAQKSPRWTELAKTPAGRTIQAQIEAHVTAHRMRVAAKQAGLPQAPGEPAAPADAGGGQTPESAAAALAGTSGPPAAPSAPGAAQVGSQPPLASAAS